MTGVIIVGHGTFAEGINSVVELVVGKKKEIAVINFLESDSTENLYEKIKTAIDTLNYDDYLIFTDLPGGSPFKEAVKISLELKNCEVIAGTNVPMLMEILFSLDLLSLEELKNQALSIGKSKILSFEMDKDKKDKKDKDNTANDGI
jgi:PTS system N-acetylgalactosamine-specific IIA component